MPFEFRLPDVGEGTDTGQIVTWHVQVGDEVKEDQPLVDVETDKAIVTIPCPTAGVVLELGAEAGDTVRVHEVLAVFENEEGEEPSADAETPHADPARPSVAAEATRPLASPAVRKLARDVGVDLSRVAGGGPGGRIRREDVEAASGVEAARLVEAAHADEAASRKGDRDGQGARADVVEPLSGIRKSIARTLTRSWQTIPHVIDYREADVTRLVETRRVLKADAQRVGDSSVAEGLTLVPLLVKMVATLLERHPRLNAAVDMEREEVTLHGSIEVGVATATSDGLLVPVVSDADRKSLAEIAREVAELAAAARNRKLTPGQLAGATFTVNNYGALGVWLGTPIIGPNQVANLGVGRVEQRPVVRDGKVVIRPIMAIACSADHRLLDGDTLALFVSDLVELIEEPTFLLKDLR